MSMSMRSVFQILNSIPYLFLMLMLMLMILYIGYNLLIHAMNILAEKLM